MMTIIAFAKQVSRGISEAPVSYSGAAEAATAG
jgi:hypothetical protein